MNKVAYTATLAAHKYKIFVVVPHFLVHMPHPVVENIDLVKAEDRLNKRRMYEEYVDSLMGVWSAASEGPNSVYENGFFI